MRPVRLTTDQTGRRDFVVRNRPSAHADQGKQYENTYCFVFRFNDDGKIQYLTEHWNTWHAYRQLFNNFEVEPAHPLD